MCINIMNYKINVLLLLYSIDNWRSTQYVSGDFTQNAGDNITCIIYLILNF